MIGQQQSKTPSCLPKQPDKTRMVSGGVLQCSNTSARRAGSFISLLSPRGYDTFWKKCTARKAPKPWEILKHQTQAKDAWWLSKKYFLLSPHINGNNEQLPLPTWTCEEIQHHKNYLYLNPYWTGTYIVGFDMPPPHLIVQKQVWL